jgi:hypothetical protein
MRTLAWRRTRSRVIVMAVCVLGHAALLTVVRWHGPAAGPRAYTAPEVSRPITWVAIPLATRPPPQSPAAPPARTATDPRPIALRASPLPAASESVTMPALQAATAAEPGADGAASAPAPLDLRLRQLPTSPANPSATTMARDALARDATPASGVPQQGRVADEARGPGKHRVHYHGKCYDSHDTRASQLDPFTQANRTLQQLKPC